MAGVVQAFHGTSGLTRTRTRSRVLILTTPIGGGHAAVARATAERLRLDGHDVVLASPLTSGARLQHLGGLYARLVTAAPLVWWLYYQGRSVPPLRNLNSLIIRREVLGPLRALDLQSYDAVLLTSSVYAHCIEEIADQAWTGVVATDLFDGPPEWFLPGADAYVVPSVQMRQRALESGIDDGRIWVRRLPTLVSETRALDRGETRRPRLEVLVVGGTEGFGPLEAVSQHLSLLGDACRVTVVCGHNQALLRRLRRRLGHCARVWGYVPDLGTHFNLFDVVLTKPGSATMMEILDSGSLFALLPGIPGIETGNERRVATYGSIPVLRDGRSAAAFLRACFSDGAALSPTGRQWADDVDELRSSLPTMRFRLGHHVAQTAAA